MSLKSFLRSSTRKYPHAARPTGARGDKIPMILWKNSHVYSKTPMRDALVKEFKAALLGKAPPFPEEDLEQRKKDYLTFLLQESV
jgi:hypothetical protein